MRRREFLRVAPAAAAGAAAFPTIIRASALGLNGALAPSERVVMAGVGFGMQGPPNMQSFLEKDEVRWVAVCDLDRDHLAQAAGLVNKKYGSKDCATYTDYRELLLRKDIDAVSIAVPDHWHAILSIASARNGWDIYGEKPFTHSLVEGRALCEAVKRYGRVWQTGSWQRSPGPRSSSGTAGSGKFSGSRSGFPPAITTSPGRSARKKSPPRRPSSTTRPGSARPPSGPTARPGSI
jgi:hypothetical protein